MDAAAIATFCFEISAYCASAGATQDLEHDALIGNQPLDASKVLKLVDAAPLLEILPSSVQSAVI